MRMHRLYCLPALLLLLSACAQLGLQSPQNFSDRLAAGYVTVTAARDTTATLLSSGKITAADAQNVQQQADNARSGLDIARQVHETNPAAGDDKLAAILTGLNALSRYLNSRKTL
jgi:hypothetical protein